MRDFNETGVTLLLRGRWPIASCEMTRNDPIAEIKQLLAAELVRAIDGWTPGQLIYRMKIDQPRISDLRRGRLERISTERLIRWLTCMGRQVQVRVVRR